jgi:predicted GIY-YIG superfamily endonuclease
MAYGRGGWVYIMSDRYRGAMYVGVTAHLAARIHQHRTGDGSDFFAVVTACTGSFGRNTATRSKRVSRMRNG